MNVTYEVHEVNVGKKPIKKLLCCLSVKSDQIREVRKDLGLDPYWIKYGMHMTLVEKIIVPESK